MKRFFTWKVARRLLIGFVVLITLVAVVWAIENYRGNRAWAQYKAELESKGEKLDLKSMVPAEIPDDQNMAMASFFTNLNFQSTSNTTDNPLDGNTLQRDLIAIGISAVDDKDREVPDDEGGINLVAWQQFYKGNTNYPQPAKPQTAAEDVLVALSRFDEEIDLLHHAAAERPLTRFPIRYEDGMQVLLPHLSPTRGVLRVLRLRSAAYLELGRNEEAFKDTQLALRITDSTKEEPLLISYLVRLALLRVSSTFVKEAIVRHGWNDEQLKQLQAYFRQANALADYHKAMRGERTFANDLLEAMGRGEYSISELVSGGAASQNSSMKWILPMGWLRQNQRYMAKMHEDITLPAVDPKANRVFPEIIARGNKVVEQAKKGLPNPHNMFAPLLLPAVLSASKRTAELQTIVDQTMLACALERYYLANNKSYPDSLQDLVPKFVSSLPHDVITGAPLKYGRTANGFYRIYSTGWNGKDDGDKAPPRGDSKKVDLDWVWEYRGK